MLKQDVESILEKADYDYAGCSGCFDIIARKTDTLLLKVLENVDSIQKEQAANLKVLAQTLVASPAIIGLWTRRERLCNDIVYDRFDIPTFTPHTLENVLVKDIWPFICRFRGGFFAEIDPDRLRAKREQLGLSQSQLARKAGVTKKNIYEHESKRMPTRYDTVKRLERIVGELSEPLSFWDIEFAIAKTEPRGKFEKSVSKDLERIGFDTNFVYQTPFNIVANTERFLLLSDAEENPRRAEKNEKHLLSFSEITEKPILVVTKTKINMGLPVLEEKELKTMTKKEVMKVVKGW